MRSEPTLCEAMEALWPFVENQEILAALSPAYDVELRRAAKAYDALSRANAAADVVVPRVTSCICWHPDASCPIHGADR